MIIYRGLGFLPLLLAVTAILTSLLPIPEGMQGMAVAVGLSLAAVATAVIGWRLNGALDGEVGRPSGVRAVFEHGMFDEAAGRGSLDAGRGHSLYYVRLEYWALPLLVGAALAVILG